VSRAPAEDKLVSQDAELTLPSRQNEFRCQTNCLLKMSSNPLNTETIRILTRLQTPWLNCFNFSAVTNATNFYVSYWNLSWTSNMIYRQQLNLTSSTANFHIFHICSNPLCGGNKERTYIFSQEFLSLRPDFSPWHRISLKGIKRLAERLGLTKELYRDSFIYCLHYLFFPQKNS